MGPFTKMVMNAGPTSNESISKGPFAGGIGERKGRLYCSYGKRMLDLSLVMMSLVFLLPLIGIVSLALYIKHGPPLIYRQVRPGFQGRPFRIYKFRTMRDDKDTDEILLSDAARLTPIGRFLRSTSLDELPEFFNVLKGDMSLVGPRPLLMEYLDRYTPEQRRRHEVKPGITGWAQVNGRNAITWEQKFTLDVWYVDNVSLLLDLKIIGMTIWKILKREGISQPGHATSDQFMGDNV